MRKEFYYDDIKGTFYDQYGTPCYFVKSYKIISIKPDQIVHAYASGIGDIWLYRAEDCDYCIQEKQYDSDNMNLLDADYFYKDSDGRIIYLKVEG